MKILALILWNSCKKITKEAVSIARGNLQKIPSVQLILIQGYFPF